jgi:pimeloyl-ACP methyl ester carboxylesterase
MFRVSVLLLFAMPLLAAKLQAQEPPLSGRFMGEIELQGETTVFRLTVTSQATADLLPAGPMGLPVKFAAVPSGVRFELAMEPAPLVLEGKPEADEIAGTVRRGEAAGRFRMTRLAEIAAGRRTELQGSYETPSGRVIWIGPFGEFGAELYVLDFESGRFGALYPRSETTFVAGPAIVVPLFPLEVTVTFQADETGKIAGLTYQEGDGQPVRAARREVVREDVSFRNGEVTLAGAVTVPKAKGPHPAVVLIHGSGPEDRNFLGPWIDFFARQGLAVLSYDKRGVGASGGDWRQSGIEDLAGDAEAAFRYLSGRAGVDPKRIGLFGISQGGWIAPLVASRVPQVAFIVLHAGAAVPVVRQGELLLEHELRAYGLPEEQIAEALAHQRLDDEFTRSGKGWEKVQASYRKASEAKAAWLWAEPQPPDAWFRTMYRKMMDFDPAPHWRQVTCPVLAFFGELDHNVPPEPNIAILDKVLKDAGHQNHSIEVLPKANHLFLQAETGLMAEYPRLQGFVPGYFERLGQWVRGVTAGR